MQSMTHHDVLSTLLNSTFGKGGSSSGTVSITPMFSGNTLTLKYKTVVHFAEERSLQLQVERVSRESIDHLASCVAELKKNYKEATGKSLKLSDLKSTDSMELVSGLSPRKVAYYRRMHVLEVG
jgi:hypothetical protein